MKEIISGRSIRLLLTLLFCCLLLSSITALGQSTTQGAIGGAVSDQSNAMVANAKITVRNLGTHEHKTGETDSFGSFRILALTPGQYEVKVEAPEYAPYRASGLTVEVGRVSELKVHLKIGVSVQSVQVIGEAPAVNTIQEDFATNVSRTAIANLPAPARRWSTFALLTPGVVPDGPYYLLSFRGISGLMNNNTVDGGDYNDAYWSEERGRTRLSYTVSPNSVQEFQVNTSNYSAEYGRAAGGVVNSVTKSGTNTLHGEGFFFDRDNAVGATNPFSKINVLQNGGYVSEPYKPVDRRYQFGGNLGGTIIKDKLFYFFNYDGQRRNFPGVSVPSGATFLAAPSPAELASLTADTKGAVTAAQAPAVFQTGLNFLAAETGIVPRTGTQDIFFPKLDWVINQKNTFTASYNRMSWSSPDGIQTSGTSSNAKASWGNDYVKTNSVNGRLNSTLTNNLLNEIRYGWGRDFQFATTTPPTAAETGSIPGIPSLVSSNTGTVPDIYISNGITAGSLYYLPRKALPDETRNQFVDTLSWTHGHHLIKAGFDFDRSNDLMSNLYGQPGEYSYSTRVQFISDLALFGLGQKAQNWGSYQQGLGSPAIEFHTWDYAGFLQDDWKIAPRLVVNLGVRYEYEQLPAVQYPNPNFAPTQSLPSDKNNIGPRVGFAWDVFGDGKTALRGGYGMYYGRITNSAIESALFQTGVAPAANGVGPQYTVNLTSTSSPCAPSFPVVPKASAFNCSASGPSITYMDPKLQNPQIHQVDFVLEQQITRNTVASISYLGSFGRELPNFIDTNVPATEPTTTASFIINDPTNASRNGKTFNLPYYSGARPTSPYCWNGASGSTYGNCAAMVEMKSNINSSYNAFVVQLNRKMYNGLQFTMNYTWSHAIDNGQNSTTNIGSNNLYDPNQPGLEKSSSNFDTRQRFVGAIVWKPLYFQNSGRFTKAALNGWTVSPVIVASTGKPYSESVSGQACDPTVITKCTSLVGLNGGLNGIGGTRLVDLFGRNSFRYPDFANVDLRFARTVSITERHKVEFTAEAFNLLNSQQISGLNTTMYVTGHPTTLGGPTVLSPSTSSAFGAATSASTALYGARQLQFGARYSF